MNPRTALIGVAFAALGSARGQVPVAELATPPAGAERFAIVSAGGRHGVSARWVTSDGVHMARESILLRGQVTELDSASHLGPDGMLDRMIVRGFTPSGDAAESLAVSAGEARWRSQVDGGSAPYAAPAMYNPFNAPIDLLATLVERLLATPDRTLPLLPAGRARAEPLAMAVVGAGKARRTVHAFAIMGVQTSPLPVWVDERGRFFGLIGYLCYLPLGYESARVELEKAQDHGLAARSPGMLRSLLDIPSGPVTFTHVRAFVDGERFAEDETVVVNRGVIVQVGPAGDVPLPAGGRVIDGGGKTLVPGLWDSHLHVQDDASGPLLLSLGITSARDPGNVNALTLARSARRASGLLLMPRVYPSLMIDGKGENTAQYASVATSEREALAMVRRAKADGFTAIKIYGSFEARWVRATAAEAHRLGLHVHGHLPAGMRPTEAIEAGYDEITHVNFVIMQAMPDEVVARSNGMARFEGPGRYAKDVDLNAEPMSSLVALLASRKITVDPTLNVFEGLLVPENGDLSPAFAAFVGTLPPSVERGFRQGGFALPPGVTRADYRASFARLSALVGALHRAGVPVVAGTDGSGMELVRELELYVEAGFTPAEALASATVAAARLVGVDGATGSIAVGKAADLVLVEGDPSRRIGALRDTRVVMMDGKLMDADALRVAGGFSGRPKGAP